MKTSSQVLLNSLDSFHQTDNKQLVWEVKHFDVTSPAAMTQLPYNCHQIISKLLLTSTLHQSKLQCCRGWSLWLHRKATTHSPVQTLSLLIQLLPIVASYIGKITTYFQVFVILSSTQEKCRYLAAGPGLTLYLFWWSYSGVKAISSEGRHPKLPKHHHQIISLTHQ